MARQVVSRPVLQPRKRPDKAAAQAPSESPKRLRVRPAYLLLVVFMGLFAFKFLEKTQEIQVLAAQENYLRYQNQQVSMENQQLQGQLRYEGTLDYIKEQARAVFGDTMPGEVLVQSQPVYVHPPTQRWAPPPPSRPPDPIWKQWWRVFFG